MKTLILKILSVVIIAVFISCSSDEIVNSNDENEISINFAVGEKAVYAIASYNTLEDSTWLGFLEIFSLQFDSSYTSNDTTYFIGNVEYFVPETFAAQYGNNGPIQASDRIKVSIDENWVLYQSGSDLGSFRVFLKHNSTNVDTAQTQIPTEFFQRAPVFPRVIKTNTDYSILRPGNNDNFLPVYRDFSFKNFIDWNDEFGSGKGVEFEVKHFVASTTLALNFTGVIDDSGILISQSKSEVYITTPDNPDGESKFTVTEINRRIEDFTSPTQVNSLSFYADLVIQKGFVSVIILD